MQAAIDNLTFEEWWAELADAVRAWLLRRRVPPHLVDDIVQETGLRLFKMWDEIDAMRSPRGLAFTIASNLLWDERNRRAAREVVGDVPERSCEDVETAGIARLELARVKRAMGRLNPQQRAVLLAEIGDGEGPNASPDAIKMMRMRARRRLTALLDTAPAGLFAYFKFPRRLLRVFRSAQRSTAIQLPTVAVFAACTTIAMIGIPSSQPATGISLDATTVAITSAHTAASAGTKAIDPASRSVAERRGASIRSTRAPGPVDKHEIAVEVPEGTPAYGETTVTVESSEEFEIQPPECSVEPNGSEVHVRCGTQVGDKRVETDTVLGIEP